MQGSAPAVCSGCLAWPFLYQSGYRLGSGPTLCHRLGVLSVGEIPPGWPTACRGCAPGARDEGLPGEGRNRCTDPHQLGAPARRGALPWVRGRLGTLYCWRGLVLAGAGGEGGIPGQGASVPSLRSRDDLSLTVWVSSSEPGCAAWSFPPVGVAPGLGLPWWAPSWGALLLRGRPGRGMHGGTGRVRSGLIPGEGEGMQWCRLGTALRKSRAVSQHRWLGTLGRKSRAHRRSSTSSRPPWTGHGALGRRVRVPGVVPS